MKQDFLDAVSSLVGRLMEDSIHTSAPSKVGKVENNHTAKLTPNLKVTTDDGREVPYPEISGTIILMPCGAGGTVGFAFPVKSDDGCLALFNEGGSGTDLKWDLSNAALLPGLYQSPGEQVKKAGSEEAAIMFAPSSTITVTKDKIEIKKAVEVAFGKKVASVRTANYDGKLKRQRRSDAGRTAHWKKAYVKLANGETLDRV